MRTFTVTIETLILKTYQKEIEAESPEEAELLAKNNLILDEEILIDEFQYIKRVTKITE